MGMNARSQFIDGFNETGMGRRRIIPAQRRPESD
jgi:hypothetical protein